MARPPGSPKTPGSGRKPGTRNKATVTARTLARLFVDDTAYQAALKARLLAGEAGAMEATLWAYAYGKPTVSSDAGEGPVVITIHF